MKLKKPSAKNTCIDVRLVRKHRTLRTVLKQKPDNGQCQLPNCAVSDNTKCFRTKVVYKIICDLCRQCYIGSTIRHLHQRVKEHLTDRRSSVGKHLQLCQSSSISKSIQTEIIASDHDEANLRLREAILINRIKPTINSREEASELREFLFL